MSESVFCPACGAPISARATTCPTCRISLVRPKTTRVVGEIALYAGLFFVVALVLVAMIILRKIYFFRIILQVIGPFAILVGLGFFLKRHWK